MTARLLAMLAVTGLLAGGSRVQEPSRADPCTTGATGLRPSADLYCIALFPAAGIEGATGSVALNWIPGPFTTPVTARGTHRFRLALTVHGLPPADRLGPYRVYMAWAMTPNLDSVVRLGAVTNGVSDLGELALDRFMLVISAEADSQVVERTGRPVLRGESASNRMRPPDTYELAMGSAQGLDGHAGHGLRDSLGWSGVPMPPGLAMYPAEMTLRPDVRAWLPAADSATPRARPRELVRLADGDTLVLQAGPVRRRVAGREFVMLGFNAQHPGPLLQVTQRTTVVVRFRNGLDQPSTVHWHGLRLENRSDGVPDLTQDAVPPGGEYVYRLTFPDAGIYWYHPHVREDMQQDLGLAGNILVQPLRPDFWSPADREEVVLLDDLLVGEDGLVPYGLEAPTHALMGRFGNVFLTNGEPRWTLRVRQGEVVRFHFTNASNTRTFNVSFDQTRAKVVGSDLGPYVRESWAESVVLGPAERYVVQARFDRSGPVALVNRVRAIDHVFGRFFDRLDTLAVITVEGEATDRSAAARVFDVLRTDTAMVGEVARATADLGRLPGYELLLRMEATLPWIVDRLMAKDSIFFNPVEWEGTMPAMNWSVTGRQVRWILRDPATGRENMDAHWTFRVGDRVRLRVANDRGVFHGMQHPVHIHGQRFLVLAVNGIPNDNPVWKDTVLLPAGGTADLLLELSNPGRWMLHCHIAEHLQAGMMMAFDVTP